MSLKIWSATWHMATKILNSPLLPIKDYEGVDSALLKRTKFIKWDIWHRQWKTKQSFAHKGLATRK